MTAAEQIRRATIQTYLFSRALRRLARDAAAELQARGIEYGRTPPSEKGATR